MHMFNLCNVIRTEVMLEEIMEIHRCFKDVKSRNYPLGFISHCHRILSHRVSFTDCLCSCVLSHRVNFTDCLCSCLLHEVNYCITLNIC